MLTYLKAEFYRYKPSLYYWQFSIHHPYSLMFLLFELVSFGTPYLPRPFQNPKTYLTSNLTSTNLISFLSSPYLLNFPFSFFLCQSFVVGSFGLSLTLLTKKIVSEAINCLLVCGSSEICMETPCSYLYHRDHTFMMSAKKGRGRMNQDLSNIEEGGI